MGTVGPEMPDLDGEPFASSEAAWIWAVQGMQSRIAGANVKAGMASISRPCEASDVLTCAHELCRQGRLARQELRVMLLYGGYAAPPAHLGEAHSVAVPFWRRGLEVLAPMLEQKGIIRSCRYDSAYAR